LAPKSGRYLGLKEYKVVGTRPIRHDGVDKVTGRAVYGADVRMAGLLYGKVLRSPHAHARIKSIDTRKAEAHPGVKSVITAADMVRSYEDKVQDLGEEVVRMKHLFDATLASDKVLYNGYPVAAVAAVSANIAEEALELIEVDYEVLPAVLDLEEAMKDGAPLLHEDMTTTSLGEKTDKKSNISTYFQQKLGDTEAGFQEADVVVERAFKTGMVHQGYIEPQNATAIWGADDQITIWCSNQGAFGVRDQVAQILGVSLSQVRVIPTEIGGGFGGKIKAYLEPLAAIMSKKTGHPVKIVMTRTEVLQATGPTSGSIIRVKMGAKKTGEIVAAEAYLAYESGAFPGCPVGAGARCMLAPYNIPNVLIDGYEAVVNKPSTSAYRAPGVSNAAFASECVVDELAEKLGMDPMEFRLKNASKEGTRLASGQPFPKIGQEEVVRATLAHPHYSAPLEGPNRGRGVASGFWGNGGGTSSATASVNPDGTVSLVEGSTDIGGTRTACAMQVAEALGITAEEVSPSVGDTDAIGYTGVTGGSRTTFATGIASYEAAQDIIGQMKVRAAKLWEISEEEISFEDGTFASKSDASKTLSFKELAGKLGETGGPVVGRASLTPSGAGGAFASVIVDVEVDPETGKVDILRSTILQDVGTAIYPSYVEGQMQGGVAQGIGWALNEEYVYDEKGVLKNASLLDYRMPTCLDLPMIETEMVEVPNPGHPYGVRGVGEVPIIPPPAAVANAIYRAIGVRMLELPMSPPKILEAVWSRSKA